MHQVTDRIRRSVRRRNRYNIRKDTADQALLLPINRRRILYQSKNQQNRLEYMRRQYAEIENEPSLVLSSVLAVIYVISGAIQPLLMYLVKDVGLSDPHCQLYMVSNHIIVFVRLELMVKYKFRRICITALSNYFFFIGSVLYWSNMPWVYLAQ